MVWVGSPAFAVIGRAGVLEADTRSSSGRQCLSVGVDGVEQRFPNVPLVRALTIVP